MRERLFPRPVLIFLIIFAAAALIIGFIGALLRNDPIGNAFLSALEAAILAFAGGLLARSFISFLLWTGRDSPNVAFLLGWGFFLWPGLIDTIPRLLGKQYLTRPNVLLWIAASVGAFTGMMNGLWQTPDWIGPGLPAFVLDETWGLAGTTNGNLLHLLNFIGGDHVVGETRTDFHRYQGGFTFVPNSGLTLGAVMSSISNSDPDLQATIAHENTHIWQNRLFGPIYTLTYLAWMVLLFLPGLAWGLISGDGAGVDIQAFSYYSNPWEAWGYAVGEGLGDTPRTAPIRGPGIWPDWAVWLGAIIFFLLFLYVVGWRIVYRVWSRARS
jgi:hypothetical protein